MHIKRALVLVMVSMISFSADAAPVQYAGNGHYYEVFSFADTGRLDWDQAKMFAENSVFNGSHGYLATLTSREEDDFVWGLGAEGTFLGAYDNSTYSNGVWTHNQWHWVTGEAFAYSDWLPGEPNNWQDGSDLTPNNEDYLMYWWMPNAGANGRWNDTNLDSSWMNGSNMTYSTRGFVVEYDAAVSAGPIATVPVPPTLSLLGTGLIFLARNKKGRKLAV